MLTEVLSTEKFIAKDTGEVVVFDQSKFKLIEARSFPGPEWQGELENFMRRDGLVVLESSDNRTARGLKKL